MGICAASTQRRNSSLRFRNPNLRYRKSSPTRNNTKARKSPLANKALHIIICLLAAIIVVSCGGYARNYKEPVIEEGHIRARKLLSVEQQREYDKIYTEAICQKLAGRDDAAYELLLRALEINPNASEALFEAALCQLELPSQSDSVLVAKGEAMLLKSVQLEPSNLDYQYALAERWIRSGKYSRATALYENIVKKKKRAQDVTMLARLYSVLGDYSNALSTIEMLEKLEGEDETTAIAKFHILLEMGKTAQAFGTIEQLSEANPDDLRYRVLLGDMYLQNGYGEKALGIYNDVLTSDPDNKLVKISMLQYHDGSGDSTSINKSLTDIMLDASIDNSQKKSILQQQANQVLHKTGHISDLALYRHFREALTLPQDDSSLALLCVAYAEAAKLPQDSLVAPLQAVLKEAPDEMQARLELLSIYAKQEKTEEIATLCHEGTLLHPDALIFYYYEGLAYNMEGDQGKCREAYERATAYITDDTEEAEMASDIYAMIGDICHELGEYDNAYAAYEKAIAINPDNIMCLNNYAYFLALDHKNLDKALQMSKRTVEAEPKNATYLDTYAWIFYCKRQYTQAKIYIDETLKAIADDEQDNARNASLYEHAGDIYYHSGDRKAALEYWKHALDITDDEDIRKSTTKKIKYKKP